MHLWHILHKQALSNYADFSNSMAEREGFGLSSRSARCRAADSLVFDSVRLFKSRKICTCGIFYTNKLYQTMQTSVTLWRRGGDLNPRSSLRRLHAFQAV